MNSSGLKRHFRILSTSERLNICDVKITTFFQRLFVNELKKWSFEKAQKLDLSSKLGSTFLVKYGVIKHFFRTAGIHNIHFLLNLRIGRKS